MGNIREMCFFSLTILFLFLIATVGLSDTITLSNPPSEQFSLYKSVLQADVIAAGKVEFVTDTVENTRPLLRLVSPEIISGNASSINATKSHSGKEGSGKDQDLLILSPERRYLSSPLILSGQDNLVFLRRMKINETLKKDYGLKETAIVYEVCDGFYSAIVLNFARFKDLPTSKVLKEQYGITTKDALLKSVRDLSVWRDINNTPGQVTSLIQLLNDHKNSKFYREEIPPMIIQLILLQSKDAMLQFGGQQIRKELMPLWSGINSKTDLAHALLHSLNNNPLDQLHLKTVTLMLNSLGFEISKTEGIYSIKTKKNTKE